MPEWDENKRVTNLANHGVDFRELDALDWSEAVEFEDERHDYGERRLIAIAPMGRRIHVVVYVERSGQRRYISARKANSREIAYYDKQMASSKP